MLACRLSAMGLSFKLTNMTPALGYLLVLLVSVGAVSYQQFQEMSDPGNDRVTLQRMVQDESTGSIYVGSVNRLYRLSGDLALELEVVTGPVEDNPLCSPPPRPCSADKMPTNNINKALVVDLERHHLISCGQVFQGICEIRRLSNLSTVETSQVAVVTNTEGGSNLAFIAPSADINVLYTAASRADWTKDNPTVAKRALYSFSTDTLNIETMEPFTRILIKESILDEVVGGDSFDINYVPFTAHMLTN